jgi:hypothetical protein
MNNFPAFLAAVAVIVASAQAFWTWQSRDDHVEVTITARQLDVCAEIGATATDFSFRTESAQATFNEDTFRAVSEAPRALAKASYMAAYLLPTEASQDAADLRDLSQRIVAALAQREEGRVTELMQQFDELNLRVQESCRLVIQSSRLSP